MNWVRTCIFTPLMAYGKRIFKGSLISDHMPSFSKMLPAVSKVWTRGQARSQAGALGAIAPSAGPIAPSGALLCTLCT